MTNIKHLVSSIPTILFCFIIILAGCGEKTVSISQETKNAQAESCLACHEAVTSPVTKQIISAEWKLSSHNLKNAASCVDCHEPEQNHPSSCNRCHASTPTVSSSSSVTHNPDAAGKCAKCHNSSAGFGFSTFNGVTRNVLKSHFSNISASYVSSKNVNNCRNCHNPHDTSSQMDVLRAWARSGHGRTKATPWNKYDFKSRDGECNRCHTTTGFIKYTKTGDSKPWGTSDDKTKEMLGCNACHNDYSYSVRSLGAVTAPYSNNSAEVYPDAGYSNICLNCHTGRESGNSIKNSTADFSNTAFINSHYLTAGGSLFSKTAYQFGNRQYDSHVKRDGTNNDFMHDKLGIENLPAYGQSIGVSQATLEQFTNAAAFIQNNGLDKAGPCVVCHLTSKLKGNNGSHTFKPYTVYSDTDTSLNGVCVNCHPTRGAGSNAKVAWFEQEWKRNMNAGLAALKTVLDAKGLYFYNTNPYFFKDANGDGVLSLDEAISANKITDWTAAFGAATAKNTMGAAFNYNLIAHDPGAIAHNRMYVRRVLYDSIDFMDDGSLNYSVGSTINNLPQSDSKDFAAILLISNVKHNGLSGKERRPMYTNADQTKIWQPVSGDDKERY